MIAVGNAYLILVNAQTYTLQNDAPELVMWNTEETIIRRLRSISEKKDLQTPERV